MQQDLRDAARSWRARPGLTSLAVVTLALAVGATMVCFSLLDAIAYKLLPVDQPGELVAISTVDGQGQPHSFTHEYLRRVADGQQVVGELAAYLGETYLAVETAGVRSQDSVELVGGTYFDTLHVRALAGRLLLPSDDGPTPATTAKVAVISERLWRERFGSRPEAIGQSVTVAGEPLQIVGVMPASFAGLQIEMAPDLVVPMQSLARYLGNESDPLFYSYIIGRLRPPATMASAQAALDAVWPNVTASLIPAAVAGSARQQALNRHPVVRTLASGFSFLRPKYQTTLQMLTGLAGWMLLTACVSLAGLLLSRAIERTSEFRIRVALGASRANLVRQLAVESVCLASGGTAAGLGLAAWLAPVLLKLLWPSVSNMTVNLHVDWRMAAGCLLVAVLTSLVMSVAPAWLAAREARLGASRHARTVTRSPTRWSEAILALQLAVSLVLLIGAGLFVRTLGNLTSIDLGFNPHGLSGVSLQPRLDAYKGLNDIDYYRGLLTDLASIPGVRSAALMPANPFGGPPQMTVAPTAAPDGDAGALAGIQMTSPGFFATLGVSFVTGRDFTWHDTPDTPLVAVVSRSLAVRLFPAGDSVGRQIRVGPADSHRAVTVIGVIPDTHFNDLHAAAAPVVYLAKAQEHQLEWSSVIIRTSAHAGDVDGEVRRRVAAHGREDVTRIMGFETARNVALIRERLAASLGAAFGGLAMFLVAVASYGLVSQSVARRTRELGLRLALGSSRADLARLVVSKAVRISVIGAAVGSACAWTAARVTATQLYGVTPHDPLVYAGATFVLIAVVAGATLTPAWRASRLSPLDALRVD